MGRYRRSLPPRTESPYLLEFPSVSSPGILQVPLLSRILPLATLEVLVLTSQHLHVSSTLTVRWRSCGNLSLSVSLLPRASL